MPKKGNLVRSISDQIVLPTDIIHGKSKFYAFYVEMMFGSSRADYLWLFMIWSIVQIVLALEPGGCVCVGGGTAIYGLYGYVPL